MTRPDINLSAGFAYLLLDMLDISYTVKATINDLEYDVNLHDGLNPGACFRRFIADFNRLNPDRQLTKYLYCSIEYELFGIKHRKNAGCSFFRELEA